MTRTCGSCSLCCKLPPINETIDYPGGKDFIKPPNEWCKLCVPGKIGCTVYDDRPISCQTYACTWLYDEDLPDNLRPDKSKVIIEASPTGKDQVVFRVEPQNSRAWARGDFLALTVGVLDSYMTILVYDGLNSYSVRLENGVVIERQGTLLKEENEIRYMQYDRISRSYRRADLLRGKAAT